MEIKCLYFHDWILTNRDMTILLFFKDSFCSCFIILTNLHPPNEVSPPLRNVDNFELLYSIVLYMYYVCRGKCENVENCIINVLMSCSAIVDVFNCMHNCIDKVIVLETV